MRVVDACWIVSRASYTDLGVMFCSHGILAADSLSDRGVRRPGDNYLHRAYRGEAGTIPVVAMATDVVQKATEGKTSYSTNGMVRLEKAKVMIQLNNSLSLNLVYKDRLDQILGYIRS